MNNFLRLICFFIFSTSSLYAQTFSNNNGTSIPDINSQVTIPVTVNGLPNALNSSFGLTGVCLNVTHPFIGQLVIVLKAPNSSDSVRLIWHEGGNSAINGPICLSESASNYIAAYPVNGITNYFGNDDNNIMNNGRNPNGIWEVRITDIVLGSAGNVNSVSLTFGNNPPFTHSRIFGCSTQSPWGCRCPDGTNDCDLLPDMTNAEAALTRQLSETATELRFGVATPNIGAGPLEMNGSTTECFCDNTPVVCGTTCPTGQELRHKVYQKVYHRANNTMTSYTRLAGEMEFHTTHNHIHVDHWTNNTLRIRSRDANPANWPIVGTSYKISFCLINLGTCDSYPNYCVDANGNVLHTTDIPNYGFGMVSGCSLGQGIYPGKVDEYGAGLPGQNILLDGICNGSYFLVSITDPDNVVKEIDENNNWAITPVHLTQRPSNCCKANFYADTLHGVDSLTVRFSDSTIAIPNEWHWDFGDGSTSTEQFPTHTYEFPGTYSVSLYTSSETGCKDTVVKNDYVTVTPSPIYSGVFATVYPNPFKEKFTIKFISDKNREGTINIFDVTGRLIHKKDLSINKGISSQELLANLFGANTGFYLISVDLGEYRQTFKVIKK